MIGVEPAGEGLDGERHGATLLRGRAGVLHGSYSMILQDDDGQVQETHSISAGLDYSGVGPEHALLQAIGRVRYISAPSDHLMLLLLLLIVFLSRHRVMLCCAIIRPSEHHAVAALMKAPELLAPAGTLNNLRYAIAYGADAVYAGMPRYSLRVRNNDFREDNLRLGIAEAHAQGFTRIILPLSFPALASFAIFQFLWTWNDLLVAKVFLIDMSGLQGLLRVFSFLALGLSLAGLAWINRWMVAKLEEEAGDTAGPKGGAPV